MVTARHYQDKHQQGPVEQVQGVGAVAQVHQGLPAEESIHAHLAVGESGDNDERCRQRGPQGHIARKLLSHLQNKTTGQHADDAQPAKHNSEVSAEVKVRQHQGEQ